MRTRPVDVNFAEKIESDTVFGCGELLNLCIGSRFLREEKTYKNCEAFWFVQLGDLFLSAWVAWLIPMHEVEQMEIVEAYV